MPKRYKKKNKIKKILLSIIVASIITIILIYLYYTYKNIKIYDSNYETQRTISTANEQTVDNAIENSKTVSDILEETMQSVVGISKLKNSGSSIFSSNNEYSLGLGTGVIVTDNGYILSNEHVTGSKLSTCYVTLEDGKKYDGTVVWSDSDLDLSITKIASSTFKPITFISDLAVLVLDTEA